MLEDRLLVRRFQRRCEDAPCRIYEKYKDHLLSVGTALLGDVSRAEDIVHDVFVAFAENIDNFELTGSLKAYLSVCVANRARNARDSRYNRGVALDEAEDVISPQAGPDRLAQCSEQTRHLGEAMEQLPYEQREVVILRLKAEMKFKHIAAALGVPISTVQSRYHYAIDKLRSLLDR